MALEYLENHCQRFLELMQQGTDAINRKDATTLLAVSAASDELLAQIERAWYQVFDSSDVQPDGAEWARLRTLLAEAMVCSSQNQRRIAKRVPAAGPFVRVGPPQGTA